MRILLLTKYFPPEIGTASHLFHELAEVLAKRGHDVTVGTTFPWYNLNETPQKYRRKLYMIEKMAGFRVVRFASVPMPEGTTRLLLGHGLVPPSIFISGLLAGKHDVIFTYSPPLLMGLASYALRLIWGVPFVFGVQDLHPQCYIDQGKLNNPALIRLLEWVERFIYSRADAITVHSEGNRQHVTKSKGAAEENVHVVPNWVDTDLIVPLPRHNRFSKMYGLDDLFVVSYAGTLGVSQGLLSLIDAAAQLRDRKDVLFLVVGDGVEKSAMVSRARERRLANVKFLPMQPKAEYPLVLASSDVSMVFLNAAVRTPVVPSKILSIMAAGRPVLAGMPLDGDAPKLIRDARCGLVVEPESPDQLSAAILQLRADSALCETMARNGRAHAEEHFSVSKCVSRVEDLLQTAVRKHHRRESIE